MIHSLFVGECPDFSIFIYDSNNKQYEPSGNTKDQFIQFISDKVFQYLNHLVSDAGKHERGKVLAAKYTMHANDLVTLLLGLKNTFKSKQQKVLKDIIATLNQHVLTNRAISHDITLQKDFACFVLYVIDKVVLLEGREQYNLHKNTFENACAKAQPYLNKE